MSKQKNNRIEEIDQTIRRILAMPEDRLVKAFLASRPEKFRGCNVDFFKRERPSKSFVIKLKESSSSPRPFSISRTGRAAFNLISPSVKFRECPLAA